LLAAWLLKLDRLTSRGGPFLQPAWHYLPPAMRGAVTASP
jgi:hypothetical protein